MPGLSFGQLGIGLTPYNGGAAALAPFPAPTGLHWEFVRLNNAVVTTSRGPVIILRSN